MGVRGKSQSYIDDNAVKGRKHIVPYDHMLPEAQMMWLALIKPFPADAHADCDRPLMEAYIDAVLECRRLSAECRCATFVLVNEETGSVTKNPIFEMLASRRRLIASLAKSLRMAPTARVVRDHKRVANKGENELSDEAKSAKEKAFAKGIGALMDTESSIPDVVHDSVFDEMGF